MGKTSTGLVHKTLTSNAANKAIHTAVAQEGQGLVIWDISCIPVIIDPGETVRQRHIIPRFSQVRSAAVLNVIARVMQRCIEKHASDERVLRRLRLAACRTPFDKY